MVWLEGEDRHVGMADHDAFGQRLGKVFNRVMFRQVAERDRVRVRARPFQADGVAGRADILGDRAPLPQVLLRNGSSIDRAARKEQCQAATVPSVSS